MEYAICRHHSVGKKKTENKLEKWRLWYKGQWAKTDYMSFRAGERKYVQLQG